MIKLIPLIISLLSVTSAFAGVYGELEFDDDRPTVIKKLHASELVTGATTDSIFGNTGLNGTFICNQKLAGLSCSLYFGWEDDLLSEITLQSKPVESDQYDTVIHTAWKDAAKLLNSVYGFAEKENILPPKSKHVDNGLVFSHLWGIDKSTVIMLGIGMSQGNYYLAIRYAKRSSLE